MIVYHGSKNVAEFPEIRKALYNKDFYFEFYCTTIKRQAIRWALRFQNDGYLNKYEYVPNPQLNCLVFEKMTEEWLDFIVSCRKGISHSYDIVEGPIADDEIYNYVQDYEDGKISLTAFGNLPNLNIQRIR